MATAHMELFKQRGYDVEVNDAGRGRRADWEVEIPGDDGDSNLVGQLRKMFATLYERAEDLAGDPIATGHALLRVKALSQDVRMFERKLTEITAYAMNDLDVRRIAISDVGTFEASQKLKRSKWESARIIGDYLEAVGVMHAVDANGELLGVERLGELVAELYGPSAAPRVTPMRDRGMDPNDYCEVLTDDDGNPVRTPQVRVWA